MLNRILTLSVCAVFLLSCSKDNELVSTDTDNELFETSPSPIELNGINASFVQDIEYDNKERTKLDIWMPCSLTPTGLVIYIHGGGFMYGDKTQLYTPTGESDFPERVLELLNNNIAVATVNYTFLEKFGESDGVLKPMNDVKRALQYLRHKADDFNIDKNNIILAGNSAGAGTALWIATNDEKSDPANADPVLHESTRVKGTVLIQTQASYNFDRWANDIFIDYGITLANLTSDTLFANKIEQLYGIPSVSEYNTPSTLQYREEVDMLELLTSDDPEFWASNTETPTVFPSTKGILNHHAYHVRELKEKADAIGVPNVCYYGKDPIVYSDPSNESWSEFCIRKLNE